MMNTETSPYHAIRALFCRDDDGNLLSIEGGKARQIEDVWSTIKRQMKGSSTRVVTGLPSGLQISTVQVEVDMLEIPPTCPCSATEDTHTHTHIIRELFDAKKGCYVGLVRCDMCEPEAEKQAFGEWFESFLLLETTLVPAAKPRNLQPSHVSYLVEKITRIFESTLRNVALTDEWTGLGADLFTRRVLDFVSRNQTIQMAVPAFPCKSPNMRKVGGFQPDMAERIALRTLHGFAQSVGAVYPPGVTVWVISDGHVFSDCIGVDDQTVTDYGESLRLAYESMFGSEKGSPTIRFRSLTDMLFSNLEAVRTLPESGMSKTAINHPIQSNRLTNAETARQVMMAGCQSSRAHFRQSIANQDPSTLRLYRGQARFMQDDLSTPDFLSRSPKQRKKLSFAVAEEMLARNQAYSNLLALLLPNYIRLSIHAHSNRGPKFGICLLPRHQVRAIDSIQNRHEVVPAYEFQVPTPWHGSIIKVAGDETLYLGRAEIVRAAIEQGSFEGGWVEDAEEGGHFAIRAVSGVVVEREMGMECEVVKIVVGGLAKEGRKWCFGLGLGLRLRKSVCRMLESSKGLIKRTIGPGVAAGATI